MRRDGANDGKLKRVKVTTTKQKNFSNDNDSEKPLYLDVVEVAVPKTEDLPAARSIVLQLGERFVLAGQVESQAACPSRDRGGGQSPTLSLRRALFPRRKDAIRVDCLAPR
jgi:hypothetical protein